MSAAGVRASMLRVCLRITFVAFIALACSPSREAAPLFQTDSLSYTLRDDGSVYEGRIGVRFTNRTDATVYFENCNGATSLQLEKLEPTGWHVAWSPDIPLCLGPPITVSPRATFDSAVVVVGAHPNTNTEPAFRVSHIPGIYRIVWTDVASARHDTAAATPLPLEWRISNRFALTVMRQR